MAGRKIRVAGPGMGDIYVHNFRPRLVRNEFVCTGDECKYWQARGWCRRARGPAREGCACVPMVREQRDMAVLRGRRRSWEERCRDELAFAHFYMDWLHAEVGWGAQRKRVNRLSKRFMALRDESCADFMRRSRARGEDGEISQREYGRFQVAWERRFAELFREIDDETENLC